MQKKEVEKQFEQIINENELLIYKVCHIYAHTYVDREDLFQDIVIQLWKAFPKFKGESKMSTWIYRVAINTAITGLRKQKNFITLHEPADLPINHIDDENEKKHERLEQLDEAIENSYVLKRYFFSHTFPWATASLPFDSMPYHP